MPAVAQAGWGPVGTERFGGGCRSTVGREAGIAAPAALAKDATHGSRPIRSAKPTGLIESELTLKQTAEGAAS
ncbi:hypothetical protein D3272_24590 [Lichenibacterium ramalinae]|uniref:Uncharacterized protein n=1 Tax=Lichenibacterium ramalinae TaxID=2316527 RepID=A0A4Q2R5A8_9HYPH|nr:hypothetical protein D3272_24590 [Lichenibacterium ramalinae]